MPTKSHFNFDSGEEVPEFDALTYAEVPINAIDAFADTYVTFWFYDMLWSGEKFSFNSENVSKYDYQVYLDLLIRLSDTRVSDLLKRNITDDFLKRKKFHPVEVGKYKPLQEALAPFKDKRINKLDSLNCPLFFQIRLYDKDECQEPEGNIKKAPRIFFKLTDKGAFSIFFLDLYHELCPTTDYSGDKPITVEEQKKARQ